MTTTEADMPPDPSAPELGTARALVLMAVLLVTAVALAALTTLLPQDPYVRFQQLRHTIQFRSQWVYERVMLDPTPIDVALIGNSRIGAGVSAPQLQAELRAKTGQDIHVANLSLPQEGRNIHYVVVKRLLEARPEVKTLVISVIPAMPRIGHPAFRDLADSEDIATAPALLNLQYADDLAALPYRQISLFVQTLAPKAFGVRRALSPTYVGPGLDTTQSFTLPSGKLVDQDSADPPAKLQADSQRVLRGETPRLLGSGAAEYEFAIERTYTRKIAALAKQHGVRVIFLQLPVYQDPRPVAEAAFYRQYGEIIRPEGLNGRPELYADYGHLDTRGAKVATHWLADRLVQMNAAGAARTEPADAP